VTESWYFEGSVAVSVRLPPRDSAHQNRFLGPRIILYTKSLHNTFLAPWIIFWAPESRAQVLLLMYVLSKQSRGSPPDADTLFALRVIEIFVTVRLGFGRIAASEKEPPRLLVNLV
jgi:hypothetical protein